MSLTDLFCLGVIFGCPPDMQQIGVPRPIVSLLSPPCLASLKYDQLAFKHRQEVVRFLAMANTHLEGEVQKGIFLDCKLSRKHTK